MSTRDYNILRIDTSKTNSVNPTFGWQVKFNKKEHYPYITKLFSDGVYGGKNEAFLEAVKFRDHLLKTDYRGYDLYSSGRAMVSLPSNNTSGIVGVNRSFRVERSGNKNFIWQTTFKTPVGKTKTKSFGVLRHGELPALLMAIQERKNAVIKLFDYTDEEQELEKYIKIIDEYDSITSFVEGMSFDERELFSAYLENENITGNTKRSLFNRRVGHHIFRKDVLEYWNNSCALSGAEAFVIASHIKPWKDSDSSEKVDLFNGLALSPNYDKAFDGGFITFDKSGQIIISAKFAEQAGMLNIKPDQKLEKYSYLHEKYMKYHRNYIFKG